MGYILNIALTILIVFLELSVLPHFRIFSVIPLLVPFYIAILSYFRKGIEPILHAAFMGILFDIFSITPFGYYLVFFLLIAVSIKIIFQEGMRALPFGHYMAIISVITIIFYLTQIGTLVIQGIAISASFIQPIVFGILINLVYGILLYIFWAWYFDRINIMEENSKRR